MHITVTLCLVFLPIVSLPNFGETTAVPDVFHSTTSEPDQIFTRSTSHIYTGSGCKKDLECAYPRKCLDSRYPKPTKACDETSQNSTLRNPCVCAYPEGLRTCQSSTDCAHGDRCISASDTETLLRANKCFSCAHDQLVPGMPDGYVDSEPESCKTYTGMRCANDSYCASPRTCKDGRDATLTKACNESSHASGLEIKCFCQYPGGFRTCNVSSDCAFGDRCISVSDNSAVLNGKNTCLSCLGVELSIDIIPGRYVKVDSAEDSCKGILGSNDNGDSQSTDSGNDDNDEDGDENSICVAVSSLNGLQPSKLVYAKHRKAVVLCDNFDNCATPGHIVEYKGQAMMMKSYCGLVKQCIRRMKLVNSIRMEAGLRVESKSSDLKFTAFSARYGTIVEETILGHIIRLGM